MVILCVLQDAFRELFFVLGDFYASETQDAEVKKSLVYCKCNIIYSSFVVSVFIIVFIHYLFYLYVVSPISVS